MMNTAVGNEAVIQAILDTMMLVEGRPKATGFEQLQDFGGIALDSLNRSSAKISTPRQALSMLSHKTRDLGRCLIIL